MWQREAYQALYVYCDLLYTECVYVTIGAQLSSGDPVGLRSG